MARMSFYLGCRYNPQLRGSYYIKYGQLTKKAAAAKEKTVYGSIYVIPFASESEYNAEIERLTKEGVAVY